MSTVVPLVWRAVAREFWAEHVLALVPDTPAKRAAAAAAIFRNHGIPFCVGGIDGSGHHVPYPAGANELVKAAWRFYRSSKASIRFMFANDHIGRF